MKSHDPAADDDVGFELNSMLDIVFLLLIYFMVTASFVQEEADISMTLPARVEQEQPLDTPPEQIIDVLADGQIMLNGAVFDGPEDPYLPDLTRTLTRFRAAAADAGIPAFIILQVEDDAAHQRVVDVLNACAVAEISLVSFNLD